MTAVEPPASQQYDGPVPFEVLLQAWAILVGEIDPWQRVDANTPQLALDPRLVLELALVLVKESQMLGRLHSRKTDVRQEPVRSIGDNGRWAAQDAQELTTELSLGV